MNLQRIFGRIQEKCPKNLQSIFNNPGQISQESSQKKLAKNPGKNLSGESQKNPDTGFAPLKARAVMRTPGAGKPISRERNMQMSKACAPK